MSTQTVWNRHRFHADADDPRPMTFPPPGPFWITGYAGDDSYAVVVAYLPDGVSPTDAALWPEATEIDTEPRVEIRFGSRFRRPTWWKGEGE